MPTKMFVQKIILHSFMVWLVLLLCLTVATTANGAEHAKTQLSEAMKNLYEAQKLHKENRIDEALQAAEAAMSIRLATLGADHPDVVPCLKLIGHLHQHQDRLERADTDLRRALAIVDGNYGPAHPDAVGLLYELAEVQQLMGRYERAAELLRRAIHIVKHSFGSGSPEIASLLTMLGSVYREQGQFKQAQTTVEQAVQISQDALGEKGKVLTLALNELAWIYQEWGDHERVEELLTRAVAVGEKQSDAGALIIVLRHLGNLLIAQEEPERAKPLLRRAHNITAALIGADTPTTLRSLASLEMQGSRYIEADSLLTRALARADAAPDPPPTEVIFILRELIQVALKQNQGDRAEAFGKRALKIAEASFGKGSTDAAHVLVALGDVYRAKGDAKRALAFYQKASDSLILSNRVNHTLMASVLSRVSELHLLQGSPAAAVPVMMQLLERTEQMILREGLTLSDNRLAHLMDFLHSHEDLVYSALAKYPERDDTLRLSWATVLLRKGRVFDETAEASRILHYSRCEADRSELATLQGLRMRIARLALEGPTELGAPVYAKRLHALTEQVAQLEDGLMQRTAELRAKRGLPGPAEIVAQVADRLQPQEVLIEYVGYSPSKMSREHTPRADERYMALLLYPKGKVGAVDLGSKKDIDRAVAQLLAALSSPSGDYREFAQEAYRLLFRPLAARLTGYSHLMISPDGPLSLMPFEALLNEQNVFLRDIYSITYLTAGRDLLRRDYEIQKVRPDSVVIFADPAFKEAPILPTTTELVLGTSRQERGMKLVSLRPLPGTREEAGALKKLFPQARLFLGREASEPALLALEAPDILHIATHGIFVADSQVAPPMSRGFEEDTQPMPQNPMLRSALVLAGAQVRRGSAAVLGTSVDNSSVDDSDGLVTALEASSMNLWGTQLVVLSACGTGRGDVKLGQGVYGLRRALLVAGAETLVTSLWNVDDAITKDLMVRYYRALLGGQGRAVAMHDGAREIARQHPHPYYWASFIVIGRSEPLSLGRIGSSP